MHQFYQCHNHGAPVKRPFTNVIIQKGLLKCNQTSKLDQKRKGNQTNEMKRLGNPQNHRQCQRNYTRTKTKNIPKRNNKKNKITKENSKKKI